MEKKEIELFIDENGEWLNNISLVEMPATETNFLKFGKQRQYFNTDNEKQIVTGAVMIPEMRIYRRDETNGEYYVYFSRETVEQAAERWLKEGKNNAFNLEHSQPTGSVYVTESWIVADGKNDKAKALGLDVPAGTWMLSAKIESPELWRRVRGGEFNGFSVEGTFLFDESDKEREKRELIAEAEKIVSSQ